MVDAGSKDLVLPLEFNNRLLLEGLEWDSSLATSGPFWSLEPEPDDFLLVPELDWCLWSHEFNFLLLLGLEWESSLATSFWSLEPEPEPDDFLLVPELG